MKEDTRTGMWRVSTAPTTKTRGIDILDAHDKFVAHVPYVPYLRAVWADKEKQAYALDCATMIAAAPQMFRALRVANALVKDLKSGTPFGPEDVAAVEKAIRAALVRASPTDELSEAP